MTGITEAAKSRTPLVVVAAEATTPLSNFYVDQAALAAAVGAVPCRVTTRRVLPTQAAAAYWTARDERRTVVLNLPLDVQAAEVARLATACAAGGTAGVRCARPGEASHGSSTRPAPRRGGRCSSPAAARAAPAAGRRWSAGRARPGPCWRRARSPTACSRGNPWSLGISRRLRLPAGGRADRAAPTSIVGWGCALNMWTMRHGTLIAPGATVVQVDVDADALGAPPRHQPRRRR